MTGIKVIVVVVIIVEDLLAIPHWMRSAACWAWRTMVAGRTSPASSHTHLLLPESHLALPQLHLTVPNRIVVTGD
jgi:hypothetical protein